MKIIQTVSERIIEELHDACWYAKCAIEYKEEYRSLADTFFSLSQEEMRHSMMLHSEATKLIEDYRRTNGEPPEKMMAIYEYLHKKSIDKAEEVKRYQALYKE